MTVVYVVLAWAGGVWLADAFSLPPVGWLGLAALNLLLALWLRRHPVSRLPLLLLALALGGARFSAAAPLIDETHAAYYNDGDKITLTGLVAAEPETRDRDIRIEVAVVSVMLADGMERPVHGLILAQVPRFPPVGYGARVELYGPLKTPPADESFDYRAYLARQDIHSLMTWPRLTVLAEHEGNRFMHVLLAVKNLARQTIRRLVPEPAGALLTGILLGDDSGMPEALSDAFQTTGMTHIIAISGFNIAIIVTLFARAGRPLFGKRGAIWFALTGITLYTLLVGAEAAVVRAAIMGSLGLLTRGYLGRRTYSLATLFVAGGLMILVNPYTLWDVGFQLSFAATMSLMLYADPLTGWTQTHLEDWFGKKATGAVMSLLNEAVIITVAAQILTLPLLIAYFGQLSIISLLANALILPLQPAVMSWGGLATLLGMAWPVLGQAPAWVAWLCLQYTIVLVRALAQVPGATVAVVVGPAGLLAIYGAIGALTYWQRLGPVRRLELVRWLRARERSGVVRQAIMTGSGVAALLALSWALAGPDGNLHVVFLDVGQGDAILIVTPTGRQILVDGGLYPTRLNDQLSRQMPFWDRTLDIVVATHPDADHLTGLPGVFERFQVTTLLTDGSGEEASPIMAALLVEAGAAETRVQAASAGQLVLSEDGVRLEIVHPGPGFETEDRNDNSVSLRLVYGDFSLLLTGDAEMAGERAMAASGQDLSALVFKAGHHGSRTSSNTFFLDAVRPQIMIVSAGLDNRFGHPHNEMLARAAAVNATILATAELGSIEVITDGERMWWLSHH